MVPELLDGLRRRDRRSLSRLLSLAARGEELAAIQAALPPTLAASATPPVGDAASVASRVVAFTGSGGVGKSTLIGKLIGRVRADGKSVAVLACDPQSPLTGGALLGDRFRMSPADEDQVFIRSLATPGGSQAVAPHLGLLIRLLQAFGFDFIFLETVGAGQSDTAVSRWADLVVLLLQPESGDDLQWEKAGVLEVADIVVVHKADLPGADQTLDQVKQALALSTKPVPVVAVSSQKNQGLEELYRLLQEAGHQRRPDIRLLARQELEERLDVLRRQPEFMHMEEQWQAGKLDEQEVRRRAWQMLHAP